MKVALGVSRGRKCAIAKSPVRGPFRGNRIPVDEYWKAVMVIEETLKVFSEAS